MPTFVHKQRIDEEHPALQFKYTFPLDFLTTSQAFVRKFNYENRLFLTSTAAVEQLDDDRVQFYRRQDSVGSADYSWERVTINRATKTITSELVDHFADGSERLFERSTFSEQDGKTVQIHNVFDD